MDHQDDNTFRDIIRKRRLKPDEMSRIDRRVNQQPSEGADWESEQLLTEVLQQLPDAPFSPNFTDKVMRAVELETNRPVPVRPAVSAWMRSFNLLQYATVIAVVMVAGWFALQQRKAAFEASDALAQAKADLARAQVARDAATFHASAPVPSIEWLKDFDAISRLSSMPYDVDLDLLAAVNVESLE